MTAPASRATIGSVRLTTVPMPRVLVDLAGYALASVVALACDWGLLVALSHFGLPYLLASTISFSSGMAVAYALSIRFVFPTRRAVSREAEAAGFFAVGLLGLVLTQALLFVFVSKLSVPVALAKAPTAAVVFAFNFLCRRRLVFAASTAVADESRVKRADSPGSWIARSADICLGVGIAAATFLSHPFAGITGDGRIYIGRALADLDPNHVGRDLTFQFDGQSGFTIFRPLARGLVACVGLEAATWLLCISALTAYSFAIYVCIRTFEKSPRALAVVVAAGLLLPRVYSPFGIIAAGEALAIPRPFAEACVLLAIACLVGGRKGAAFACIGLAAVFHPIMALPGAVLLLLELCVDDKRWVLACACGASAALVAGALGTPIVSRAFTQIDPAWLAILRTRNGYLFVSTWSVEVWSGILVQTTTLLIAIRFVPPAWSRIMRGSILVALFGCLASFVGVDLLSSLLMAQIQLWRSLWLLAALAPVAAGVCLVALPDQGWRGYATLAALGAAWMTPLLWPTNLAMAFLALCLVTTNGFGLGARAYKVVCLGAALLVACAFAQSANIVHAYLLVFPPDMRLPTSALWELGFAGFWVVALVSCYAKHQSASVRLGAALCLLATAAVTLSRYDQRTAAKADIDKGVLKPGLIAMLAPRSGEVLWLGGDELWYWTRRPNWNEKTQGAGLVFSRALSLIWYDRTRALIAAHLGEENLLTLSKTGIAHPVHTYVGEDIAKLCQRSDAPAWIVMPLEDGLPAPSDPAIKVWTSPFDERTVTVDGERLVLRSASRRLLIPCGSALRL